MRNSFAIALKDTPGVRSRHDRLMKWRVLGRHRSLPHLGRKLYHLTMGISCFGLYAFVLTREQAIWTLALIGGTFVVFDLFRLRIPSLNQFVLRLFGNIMRREELKSVSGNSFYVFGLLVVVFFFPKPVVLLSVLYLAVGDPVAAIVGTKWGRHRLIGKKSLEGAVANFVVAGLLTLIVALKLFGFPFQQGVMFALAGGLISMVSELAPIPLDDNFTIPVLSAILLSLMMVF